MFALVQTGFQWFGQRIVEQVKTSIDQRLMQAGEAWLQQSRALAPVKTGFLRSQEGFTVHNGTLTLIMGAYYDIFQEFGTRNIPPRPHVRPALNAIGRIFGNVAMEFAVPFVNQPIFAHKGGFVVPPNLMARQRAHVANRLLPTSHRLHRGNVRRATMRVRRV